MITGFDTSRRGAIRELVSTVAIGLSLAFVFLIVFGVVSARHNDIYTPRAALIAFDH